MEKIVSLFKRDYEGNRLVYDEVVEGAEWVLAGEGRPTRKWDGTCCVVRDGKLYKRYEVKSGHKPPLNFEPATGIDPITGKQQGWVAVGDGPEDRWHREAWERGNSKGARPLEDGTYELLGPKVQRNAEGLTEHHLLPHAEAPTVEAPRTFTELREWFATQNIEGVVWHHPDGRMAKIKKRDFGLPRKPSNS